MRNARLPVVAAIVSALAVGGVGVASSSGPSPVEKAQDAATKRGPRGKIGPRGKPGVPGPRGPQGAEGTAGAAGKDGAQGGLSDVITTNQPVLGFTTSGDVVGLNLPAGQWLVTAHLGGAHNDPATSARLECGLIEPGGSGADFSKLRLPPNVNENSLVFFDTSLHTAVNLAGPAIVKVACSIIGDGDDGFTFTTRKMTAVRVGTITTQTP